MATTRFQMASNKKAALIQQQKREIAAMLKEEPPKEEKARIRAESLIREDNCVEAYEILMLNCELLAERIKLLSSTKECPPDLVSSISTLVWAADRVDIDELTFIKKQFKSKYGKQFEERAMNNVGGVLNDRVVSKLSVQPPAAYLVQVYLERICEEQGVKWTPKVRITAEDMAQPMAAPVGYSVQVAGASGLGEVVTGQETFPQQHHPTATGSQMPTVVPASATVVSGPGYGPPGGKRDDFAEPEIFVPSAPSAPASVITEDNATVDEFPLPPAAPNSERRDDDDNNNTGGGGNMTYDDLAARFQELKK